MAGRKILVIDDEEKYCRIIKKSLETKGAFRVLTATTGQEGIRLARTAKPDIILLDIMMSDMGGTEVAENLLDDPLTSGIPIVFVTAVISRNETGIVGGHDVIAKPVAPEELIRKINAILSKS